MYIWVILATFMVAIYSFNLSHRSDMKELLTVPQAEAIVGKMVIQHQAAEKYVNARKPKSKDEPVTFTQGELSLQDLKTYLPYGFRNVHSDSGASAAFADGDFVTLIYCLDRGPKDNRDTELSGLSPACTDVNSQAFLVTFGCIPRKWKNVRNNKPKAEFFKGMRKVSVNGTEVGYTEFLTNEEKASDDNKYKSDIGLRARNIDLVSIPRFIAEKRLPNAALSFADVCGKENVDDDGNKQGYACDKCLAYISPVTF